MYSSLIRTSCRRTNAVLMAATVALAWNVLATSAAVAQSVQTQFIVRNAQVPTYAPVARSARVTGTVTVDVHVENGVVTKATPRSGPPLLFDETARNIKTWTFDPGVTGDIASAFEYRISGEETAGDENPTIELRLPSKVTITARPWQRPCHDCGADISPKPVR